MGVTPSKAEEAWSRFLWRMYKMWDRVHWQQMVEVARDRTLTTRQRRGNKNLPALTAAQAACPHPISQQARGANQHAKWVKCRQCNARIEYTSLYQNPKEPMKSKFERYMTEEEMAQQRRDRRNRRPGDPEAVNQKSRLNELAYKEVTLSDLELEAAESEAAVRAEKSRQKRSSSKSMKRSNPQQGTASSSGETEQPGAVQNAIKQMQESNAAIATMVQGLAQAQAMATAQMSNQTQELTNAVTIMAQAMGSAAATSQAQPGPVHHRMDQFDQAEL